jgi:hypothetical protein
MVIPGSSSIQATLQKVPNFNPDWTEGSDWDILQMGYKTFWVFMSSTTLINLGEDY